MTKRNKILIIDDTPDILEALNIVLSEEGYEIDISTNEKSITELLNGKRELPHLILLDVLLSGQDGRMLAKKLKADKKTESIPIIMMSAHPDIEKSIKESGADDFLPKPFEMSDLLSKIKKNI